MTTFDLGEQFDVVLCVYDSINHLVRFREWEAVFRRAREHLSDRGVFLFDINTVHRLTASAGNPPHVQWFGDGNLMVIAIVDAPRGAVDWEINVFERVRGSSYRLHLDVIREVSFPAERIRDALRKRFARIWTYDASRARPSANSNRLHFVCRERVRPGRSDPWSDP
jgi:hypothetical protein